MRPIEQKTLDFIAEIDRVDDSESVRLLFQRFLEVEIGFTNVVCLKVPNAAETLNSTIYFNTRPEAWTEHYVEANHIFSDPMVRELYKTYDPYAWSDVLNRRKLEREDLRIVDEAGEFGMREGFVVPIYQLNGYFGLVSAAGGKLELTEQMRSVLQLTSIYVHDKVARLHRALREQKGQAVAARDRMPEVGERRQVRLGDRRDPSFERTHGERIYRERQAEIRSDHPRASRAARRPRRLHQSLNL
jgi:LuxR family transcriptional regulator, quorum-sensing system regulator BjaR1